MKITRKHLRQIIKEEVELSASDKIRIVDDAKRTLDQIGGVHKDARHFASLMRRSAYDAMKAPSDEEARTSAGAAMRASGGQGAAAIPIEAILDVLSDAGIVELDTPGSDNGIVNSNLIKKESGSSPRVSESTVKITRKQLRQIIKEAIGRVMVPTRLRGQNDREAFSSGVFENEIEVNDQEDIDDDDFLPLADLTTMLDDVKI